MRQCSHDATIEAQYTDSLDSAKPTIGYAPEGPIRDEKTKHDKRPAEDSTSP